MNELKRRKNLICDDKGSTLVTVIVVIAFVTVLTAIILSTSLVSVQMKGMDRKAKDDFYYAEKALNDVYTKIGEAVQFEAAAAYEEALVSVGKQVRDGDSEATADIVDFKLSDDAQNYYRKKFISRIEKWIDDNKDSLGDAIVDSSKMDYEISVGKADGSLVYTREVFDITKGSVDLTNVSGVRIKDVKVTAIDKNKSSQAVVVSDIVIAIPDMNFFGTNADILDYCIIANDGLSTDESLSIDGNLYAGMNNNSLNRDKSGININQGLTTIMGEVICSKGDISVGSGDSTNLPAELKIQGNGYRPELWFDSIKTVKGSKTPKIEINADVFALNDVELNADESTAKFSGNYYGYDDGTLKKTEDEEGNALINIIYSSLLDKDKQHSDSSAVIINGNQASLTMKDIDTFVLMGKAYIEPGDEEIETAEGVALKTNQQLYLVPTDFLRKPNPLAVNSPSASATYFAKEDVEIPEGWFGTKYLIPDGEITLDDGSKRKCYEIQEVPIPDKNAVYAFLKFKDIKDGSFYATLNEKPTGFLDADNNPIVIPKGTIVDDSKQYKISDTEKVTFADNELTPPFSARTGYIREIMGGFEGGRKPTAAQLRKRVNLSISNDKPGAFHLENCIIMDDGTPQPDVYNIYTQNSVVSYYKGTPAPTVGPVGGTPTGTPTPGDETPESGEPTPTPGDEINDEDLHFTISPITNTASRSRYTAYPQNMFFRYKWLCASLKSWDSIPLSGEIKSDPSDKVTDESGNDFVWAPDSDFPFIKYVDFTGSKANIDDTQNTETSDVGKVYILNSGRGTGTPAVLDKPSATNPNVYGVVICDGDLLVKSGVNVYGTILAKGTVTFEGNNLVKSDRALIQRRVNDEISKVRKTGYYRSDYLISYLIDSDFNLLYDVKKANETKLIDKDKLKYTDYVYFDDWQKGGR